MLHRKNYLAYSRGHGLNTAFMLHCSIGPVGAARRAQPINGKE
jgi:hypothetical protein